MDCFDPIIDLEILDRPVQPLAWEPSTPAGAQCTFLGTTRPETHQDHGPLVALVYEAHEIMALAEMTKLAEEALDSWSPLAIRIHHAIGPVPVGEASVLIQVACEHRHEAFTVCRWLIDELKARVPIWKREAWQDGSSWPQGTPLAQAANGEPS